MSGVPSRQARLAHAAKHAESWNAGDREGWIASRRTIAQAGVRMFDPVGTAEKIGFDAAIAHSIETFAWDDAGNLLIKTYYPMPEHVGAESDPYAHLLEGM